METLERLHACILLTHERAAASCSNVWFPHKRIDPNAEPRRSKALHAQMQHGTRLYCGGVTPALTRLMSSGLWQRSRARLHRAASSPRSCASRRRPYVCAATWSGMACGPSATEGKASPSSATKLLSFRCPPARYGPAEPHRSRRVCCAAGVRLCRRVTAGQSRSGAVAQRHPRGGARPQRLCCLLGYVVVLRSSQSCSTSTPLDETAWRLDRTAFSAAASPSARTTRLLQRKWKAALAPRSAAVRVGSARSHRWSRWSRPPAQLTTRGCWLTHARQRTHACSRRCRTTLACALAGAPPSAVNTWQAPQCVRHLSATHRPSASHLSFLSVQPGPPQQRRA